MLKFLHSIFKTESENQEHNAVLGSIKEVLDQADKDADLMKKEMSLLNAEEEWLDYWGNDFGIPRMVGESDESFRYRLVTSMDDKVSIPAIKRGVKKVMGDDTVIRIYEPFDEVRFFNVSTFSGDGRFPDPDYYRIGVIDITINKQVTNEVIGFIDLLKAASISVRFTYRPDRPLEEIVIGEDSAEQEIWKFTSSHKQGIIVEQPDDVFSGDGTSKRFSGEREIWSRRVVPVSGMVSPWQSTITKHKQDD